MQTIDRYRGEWRIMAAGVVCVVGYTVVSRVGDLDGHRFRLGVVTVCAWAVFALAALVALRSSDTADGRTVDPGQDGHRQDGHRQDRRLRDRRRLILVVLIAACCQLPGVLVAPQSSSDAYRYVWDGRVQISGTSPYRYAPLDDRLGELRDPLLFPGLRPSQPSGVRTLDRLPTETGAVHALARNDPRTRINRPRVPTIYPPFAQAWFAAVSVVTPRSWGTHGLQAAMALLAIGLTLGLGLLLGRRGRDPAQALWWGWCPLVVLEAGNGAHVDVLAAVLIIAALAFLGARNTIHSKRFSTLIGGVLLGLAAATKIIPLLLLPALTVLRRRNGGGPRQLVVPAAALGTFALTYLPHVIAAGALVLGYLPGYLSEEGFDGGGDKFGVLALVLPVPALQPVALLLAAALAVIALWRSDVRRPERTAVWLFGSAILITTPSYAWYCLPLVALAVLAARPEWLTVAIAGYMAYAGFGTPHLAGAAYAVAGLVVLVVTLARPATRVSGPAGREQEGEGRALAEFAGHRQIPLVGLDQLTRNGKS